MSQLRQSKQPQQPFPITYHQQLRCSHQGMTTTTLDIHIPLEVTFSRQYAYDATTSQPHQLHCSSVLHLNELFSLEQLLQLP